MQSSAIFWVTFVVAFKNNIRIRHSVKKERYFSRFMLVSWHVQRYRYQVHLFHSIKACALGSSTHCAEVYWSLWHAIPLPIIHREALHFSNSTKFKQNYKMPWNICFFRTNFAVVKTNKQTNNAKLVHNHHSQSHETGLGIALIMTNPLNLSACKKISHQRSRFRSALTRLLHPTGKYSIVWKIIIHISIRFKFNRYFMGFLNV